MSATSRPQISTMLNLSNTLFPWPCSLWAYALIPMLVREVPKKIRRGFLGQILSYLLNWERVSVTHCRFYKMVPISLPFLSLLCRTWHFWNFAEPAHKKFFSLIRDHFKEDEVFCTFTRSLTRSHALLQTKMLVTSAPSNAASFSFKLLNRKEHKQKKYDRTYGAYS